MNVADQLAAVSKCYSFISVFMFKLKSVPLRCMHGCHGTELHGIVYSVRCTNKGL
jgi:hypothetical protein